MHQHVARHAGFGLAMTAVAVALAHHVVVGIAHDASHVVVRQARPVHMADVARAESVAWHVDLARAQREPAHRRHAGADRHADPRPADPGHQRRRVDRPGRVGARCPAPASADEHPAPVVEGCEAPGRIVDPGPAPGRHPGPATVAVGRPTRGHAMRRPDRTVIGVALPAAVAVEVFGASHLGRDVTRRGAALITRIGRQRPVREAVAPGRRELVPRR